MVMEYVQKEGRYRCKPVDPSSRLPPSLVVKPHNLKLASFRDDTPMKVERTPSSPSGKHQRRSLRGPSFKRSKSSPQLHAQGAAKKEQTPPVTSTKQCRRTLLEAKKQKSMSNVVQKSRRSLVVTSKTRSLSKSMSNVTVGGPEQDQQPVSVKQKSRRSLLPRSKVNSMSKSMSNIEQDQQPVKCGTHNHQAGCKTGAAEQLAEGSRAVLTGNSPLKGELVVILSYNETERCYVGRPLGHEARTSRRSNTIRVAPENIQAAPQSAFWVRMTVKGRRVRVPASCSVIRERSGQTSVHVALDAFAGLAATVPVGKAILGEATCDWSDESKVLVALKASKSKTVTYDVHDRHALHHLAANETFIDREAQPEVHDAMLEFELMEQTDKTVRVDDLDCLPVYKLKFPIPPRPSIRNRLTSRRRKSSSRVHDQVLKGEEHHLMDEMSVTPYAFESPGPTEPKPIVVMPSGDRWSSSEEDRTFIPSLVVADDASKDLFAESNDSFSTLMSTSFNASNQESYFTSTPHTDRSHWDRKQALLADMDDLPDSDTSKPSERSQAANLCDTYFNSDSDYSVGELEEDAPDRAWGVQPPTPMRTQISLSRTNSLKKLPREDLSDSVGSTAPAASPEIKDKVSSVDSIRIPFQAHSLHQRRSE